MPPKKSLYLSEPQIEIDGKQASPELMKDLLQITIEESLHLPAMFTLVIHNSYIPASDRPENKAWRHEPLFKIGKKVKLGFTSSTTLDNNFQEEVGEFLIEGEITAMEVHFNEKSEADIIVRGYDISHRLHRGRYNRSFLNKTDSDIVKQIVKEVGIKPGNIEPTGEVHKYVFQENQTNMEFLRERAARIGFELFITEEKLNFCKPKTQGALSLKWLVDINKFSTRVTSAEQISSVEVRAWDYTQKQLISGTAKKEKPITETGNQLGSSTSNAFSNLKSPKMIVVDKPVASKKQAETMAQALCDELGGEFVYADAKAEGNPEIRPGRVINLQGMGDRYSGKYYVTETRHFFSQRVYETYFSVRGLRSGSLFTTLSPEKRLQPSETLLVGIVTDNKDPQAWGRVKVKFPTLTEEHTSDWARVVAVGAGPNRGFDCLPEVNDEVLVGFEHGDIHRPYVIGGVWNGKDAPPEKVRDSVTSGVRLRTIKTRVGHTLQFVEEDKGSSKTGIRVETKDGHKIYLNDSQRCIEIETKGGHRIKMDDMGKSVSVKSTGNMSLDAAGNIDISAKGVITVKGAMIRLN
ncbi:type IV secretion protein Rhs [Nostoc sp. 'Peltigera membranacea cyanobiont' 210A]|uniref:VgrG-related protein n=1 Tax=Nostoc sp. 'Peltigera membranacea cyanobiont' 210A TaxID=2014529 RepID=UPI000B95AA3E|nr:VgrG-related protein [Nostoc sp. 'Peltigera membranacea cyanobiont' 210A]OYD93269.1 type IV secretion protein Rhs [Nostoc sp. 'Peltigera membranacea cyanobiont' 210A]